MLLTKFPILFLILILRTSLAGVIIKPANYDGSAYLIEATVNFLKCYSNWGNAIAVVGDVPENFISTLLSKQLVPVVSLSASKTESNLPKYGLYGLRTFVITASSLREFIANVERLQNSIWWRAGEKSLFIILYRPPKLCANIANIMKYACRVGMINPKVICTYTRERLMVFTGNPYSYEAAPNWELLYTTTERWRNSIFNLYLRDYEKGDQICNNLDFSTKKIGGFDIYVLYLIGPAFGTNYSSSITLDNTDENEYLLAIFQYALNGTIKPLWVHEPPLGTYYDFPEIRRNIADISFNIAVVDGIVPSLYPHHSSRIHILTKFRGHKTQLQKILSVIDLNSRIGLCLVLLMTWIFFKVVGHQAIIPALMNVLRMISNAGFMNLPDNNAVKFYLIGLYFFAITMHGIYDGQLASLLTNNIPIPDVNNLQDLIDSDLTIYGFSTLGYLFSDTIRYKRFVSLNYPRCSLFVVRKPSSACIGFEMNVVDNAMYYNLHVSRESVLSVYLAFRASKTYPLLERLNKVVLQIQAAGIREPFSHSRFEKTAESFQFDAVVMSNPLIKVMSLRELTFAFIILGIGLTCATITFIMELVIHRYRSRVRTVQVQS